MQWWLSATDFCNEGAWYWCYGNQTVRFFDNSITPFEPTQPDNWLDQEHCAMTKDLTKMLPSSATAASILTFARYFLLNRIL
jgi:aryl-phospho-beta-D-glucosidase BglC (GH1 family)